MNIYSPKKRKVDVLAITIIIISFAFLAFLAWIIINNLINTTSAGASQENTSENVTIATYKNYDIYLVEAEAVGLMVAHIQAQHEENIRKSEKISTPKEILTSPQDQGKWDQLAQCECGGNWGCNTGNGFGGGLQFMHQSSYSTWISFGGGEFSSNPWDATREQQIVIAERVLASSGWNAWPGCTSKFGWR